LSPEPALAGSRRGSRQAEQRTLPAEAELGVGVIDQFTQFTGVRAAETFFEPLQLHLQPADLLEQLGVLGLIVFIVLCHHASGEELAGAIQQLPLPLDDLDWIAPRGALL